jgi:hypothetical protein
MREDASMPMRIRRWRETTCRRARLATLACVTGLVATLAMADDALADICKYIDADGNTHYSNLAPEKGWRKLGCTTGDNSTLRRSGNDAASRAAPSPPGFPRIDAETQKGRDDVRRKVLADELAAEEKLLAETRVLYADGGPVPLPEERADAEKYRTRIARLRQTVTVHEKNVEALKKELATVK